MSVHNKTILFLLINTSVEPAVY